VSRRKNEKPAGVAVSAIELFDVASAHPVMHATVSTRVAGRQHVTHGMTGERKIMAEE
jgi:hypothetical protein